jgi:hypothetical protein
MPAQMFPSKLDRNHVRFQGKRGSAEYEFYRLLREQLSDEWKVMWGRDLEAPYPIDGSTEGEADFIAVHPRFGLFVLEVKGGGLEYREDEHVWVSWGREGQEYELSRSPSAQVKRTCRLLRAIFQGDTRCPSYLKSPNFEICWAVVFNQCRLEGVLPADLPHELILDELDMDRIELRLQVQVHQHFLRKAYVRTLEQDARRGKKRRYHHDTPREKIEEDVWRSCIRTSRDGWEYLRAKFLASELRVKPPRLSTQIKQEAAQLRLLTDEQYRVIESLESKDYLRAKVRGCSGSGKTLCAIELACRFAKKKKQVLLLCYNPALREWLGREAKNRRQFIRTYTIHGFCRSQVDDLPNPLKLPSRRRTEIFDYEWPLKLSEHLDTTSKRFDVVIVDEAQDYRGLWWHVIPKLLRSDESRLFVFYDENQILYHDSAIGDIPIEGLPLILRRNCRNTKMIHDFISLFYYDPQEIICQGPVGTMPKLLVYNDEYQQKDGLRRLLARWGEGLKDRPQPYDRVVVLTLHGRTTTFLKDTPKIGNVNLAERPNQLSKAEEKVREPYTVLWSTDRRFKGLESDAVVLVEIDQLVEDSFADRLLYVGGSRARHRLYGFVHRKSLDWLRSKAGSQAEFYEDISVLAHLEL